MEEAKNSSPSSSESRKKYRFSRFKRERKMEINADYNSPDRA